MNFLSLFKKPVIKNHDLRGFLFNLIPARTIGAEIGVWKGEFSERILENVRPVKFHLIDPWQYIEKYERAYYGGLIGSQQAMDEIYKNVLTKMEKYIREGIIEIHKEFSHTASSLFKDNYFDWIYIDGNHTYEFIKRDLELYFPKVKVGGLILGDNYEPYKWWGSDVIMAVDEFIKGGSVEKVMIKNAQFVLRKK